MAEENDLSWSWNWVSYSLCTLANKFEHELKLTHFLISKNGYSKLFGHNLHMTDPLTIRDRVNDTRTNNSWPPLSLPLQSRVQRLCGSLEVLAFSSRWIWCITTEGLIPLMFAMVQLRASLCSLSTSSNFPSWSLSKWEEMIIGKVSESPRKAYFNVLGKGLSSNLGAQWLIE